MRIYLETLGCRLNYAEMATLGRQLTAAGHVIANVVGDADVCVLNSCGVTGEAARKSRQLARQMAQSNPQARLILTGCFATLEAQAAEQLPSVCLVVDNSRKDELASIIDGLAPNRIPTSNPAAPSPLADQIDSHQAGRTRAFVKVQDGCRNRCTYCVVTLARGEERSRSPEDVVDEITALSLAGFAEVVLTGVHLGAYGREHGQSLSTLLEAILSSTSVQRIRLSSLEPFDLGADFFALWQDSGGRLMPHLHLPAQSGSDSVLRRMARRNRVQEYLDLIAAARERIADLTVTTDMIVGFPGETGAEFDETLMFAEQCRFAHIHVFPFSARAGTVAARMRDQVPHAERQARSRVLNALRSRLADEVRQSFLGQVRPVLWETPIEERSPNGPESRGTTHKRWSGLTDNYLRVIAWAPNGEDLHGRLTDARLLGTDAGILEGEIVFEAPPTASGRANETSEVDRTHPVVELMES